MYRSRHGFRIDYPDAWSLQEEQSDDRHVVTVSPDGTTFWSATVLFDHLAPGEVLDAVTLAFEEEFPEVDVHSKSARLAGIDAETRTFEFVCWDLTNSAIAQSVRAGNVTLLVLYQFTDSEQDDVEDLLRGVSESLTFK